MYEQVFNFNSRPFTSTPYVKHYYPASAMNQALGQASICIERGSGPVVAIGDIGTGKSLLLAKLDSEYQNQLQVVSLVCSGVNSRRELSAKHLVSDSASRSTWIARRNFVSR